MFDGEVSFTSLCRVVKDNDGHPRLLRMADIEDDTLHRPYRSDRVENCFENRELLYFNDGPTSIGEVGVWDWTAIPSKKNPTYDYIESSYMESYSPIRIVVLDTGSVEGVVRHLHEGTVWAHAVICDTFFASRSGSGSLTGVLCRRSDLNTMEKHAKLAETTCFLPVYTIAPDDIYACENIDLKFLKSLWPGKPSEYVQVGNPDRAVLSLILKRFTWKAFSDSVGGTKAEWRRVKSLLERISGESLYGEAALRLNCSPDQARQAVDDFVKRANANIDAGDIDTDILARIAMNHDGLRQVCEEALSREWYRSHSGQIAKAEAEAAERRSKLEQENRALAGHLADIEHAVSAAEERHRSLLEENEALQNELDVKSARIEQYEALGNDTLAEVRKKIADAQENMAGFIADLSMFLPQSANTPDSGQRTVPWRYTAAPADLYPDSEVEWSETWGDELYTLSQNLVCAGVETGFCPMLAAFLYAAHINHVPLLIAGPGGRDIADALSVSLYARQAGRLTLYHEYDSGITDAVENADDPVVAVDNMFSRGWADILPQTLGSSRKQIIWTHPYAEDLAVEPLGLYNYMLPVLSECFIGADAVSETIFTPGRRADGFIAYSRGKRHPLRTAAFRRMGLSRFLIQRLETVLTDAKSILDSATGEKDLEFLFGILPLCVLTERPDILRDVIESESGLSGSVKDEAVRYLGEE